MKAQFEPVMARLKRAVNAHSYAELGRLLGLSTSAYANRKKSDSIPYDAIIHMARSRKIDLKWLFFGDGTPVKPRFRYDHRRGRWYLIPTPDGLIERLSILANEVFAFDEREAREVARTGRGDRLWQNDLLAFEAVIWDAVFSVAGVGTLPGSFARRYGRLAAELGVPNRIQECRWPEAA